MQISRSDAVLWRNEMSFKHSRRSTSVQCAHVLHVHCQRKSTRSISVCPLANFTFDYKQ